MIENAKNKNKQNKTVSVAVSILPFYRFKEYPNLMASLSRFEALSFDVTSDALNKCSF